MSAKEHTDSGSSQDGPFSAHVPGSEPITTHGHKPGKIVSEADAAPEFHAQVIPAGTAPPDRTFKPNNLGEVPPAQDKSAGSEAEQTSASDTLGGATSADVNKGVGKPF
ncbi:hypothetical protein LTR66_007742 [Elasticomyces elasticus]|nr:hypothetical protein LTR66_007742 [Elasticomyces elasticus]